MTVLVTMETFLALIHQEAKPQNLSINPGTQESYKSVLKAREKIVVKQNMISVIRLGCFNIKHFTT